MSGGARRIGLVARREWNQRARSTAFRISTVVSVLIVVAIIVVPQMIGGGAEPARTVGVVGQISSQLPALLHASGDQLGLSVKTRRFADEADGRSALRSGDVSVLLVDGRALVWKAQADDQLRAIVTSAVQALHQQQVIGELGLTADQARRLLQPADLRSGSLAPVPPERSARIALATIGVVLLFMAIVFYGGFVLVGVIEEKSSRVVEVMLSRLRPTELLAGKILGIGLVGLAQFALVTGSALVALRLSGNTLAPTTTPSTIVWILFWFVLGFAFYSVLYATAGSLVSRQEDAGHPVPDHGTPVGRIPLRVGDDRVPRQRRGDRGFALPAHGSDGDDGPHRARWRPRMADRPVGRADGGLDLRLGAPGRTDLRRSGAQARPPGARSGSVAWCRGPILVVSRGPPVIRTAGRQAPVVGCGDDHGAPAGPGGIHWPRSRWRFVWSKMAAAGAVFPVTVASTWTVCPTFTSAMPSRPASTRVLVLTTYVRVNPSWLLTVIDEALTAVTVPLCTSIVRYPPFGSTAVNSPCSTPPAMPPGMPSGPPSW